jgi:hypothetical protein
MSLAISPRVLAEQIEVGLEAERAPAESAGGEGLHTERARLMDLICSVNPTATRSFLERFNDRALRLYRDHLEAAARPRGRGAAWVRPGETPAVMVREAD